MDQLIEEQASDDPFAQFAEWFKFALTADLPQPDAMALATSTPDGHPSCRMVLLKGYDRHGFVFFTNYESRKGRELAENPQAALVVFWSAIHRQIRIEGRIEILSGEESDLYFGCRPRGSQIAASASSQSAVLADRRQLEERVQALEDDYAGRPVPRPDFWGGYRVIPEMIEFWQGRPNRLHDRLRYTVRPDGSWVRERLSP